MPWFLDIYKAVAIIGTIRIAIEPIVRILLDRALDRRARSLIVSNSNRLALPVELVYRCSYNEDALFNLHS